jgi:REP-associated tyrosine transposase
MPRLPRLQFAGAGYHVASRGVRGLPIFVDDFDRSVFLGMVEDVVGRLGWKCHAYCLMTNHFHLVVTTPEPNLAKGMQWQLACYAQWFNRRYGTAGHLVERRYRARVVDSDAYRLLVTRYVFRNPLEARLCDAPEDWPWSSYAATVGLVEKPAFLQPEWILDQFGRGRQAVERLRAFVVLEPAGSDPATLV